MYNIFCTEIPIDLKIAKKSAPARATLNMHAKKGER
jgi:hypothetical protein